MERVPPELTANARHLRNAATPAERELWHALRNHRPRFTRQLVIDRFIVDFACRSLKLAIELDGGHHGDQVEKDQQRTRHLAERGWTVLRFWNNDVLQKTEGVVETIYRAVAQATTHPQPLPFREGG